MEQKSVRLKKALTSRDLHLLPLGAPNDSRYEAQEWHHLNYELENYRNGLIHNYITGKILKNKK